MRGDALGVIAGRDRLHAAGKRAQRPAEPARHDEAGSDREHQAEHEDDDEQVALGEPAGERAVGAQAAEDDAGRLMLAARHGAIDAAEGAALGVGVEVDLGPDLEPIADRPRQHVVGARRALGRVDLDEFAAVAVVEPRVERAHRREVAHELVVEPVADDQRVRRVADREAGDAGNHDGAAIAEIDAVEAAVVAERQSLQPLDRLGRVEDAALRAVDRHEVVAEHVEQRRHRRRQLTGAVGELARHRGVIDHEARQPGGFALRRRDLVEQERRGLGQPGLDVALERGADHPRGELGGDQHRHQADEQEGDHQLDLQRHPARPPPRSQSARAVGCRVEGPRAVGWRVEGARAVGCRAGRPGPARSRRPDLLP